MKANTFTNTFFFFSTIQDRDKPLTKIKEELTYLELYSKVS